MLTSLFAGGRVSRVETRSCQAQKRRSEKSSKSGQARSMGARGPKPIPTNLRVIQGNKGKRPLPRNEPRPPTNMPEPPPYVSGYARQEWDRLADSLYRMG